MKGLFIPEITAEMFRNGCLESIEAIMAEGEIYDIEYEPERKGKWIRKTAYGVYWYECSECHEKPLLNRWHKQDEMPKFCPNCGAKMGEEDEQI